MQQIRTLEFHLKPLLLQELAAAADFDNAPMPEQAPIATSTSPSPDEGGETVTAMAVSDEDIENEVRQRILLETVVANVEYITEEDDEPPRPWYRSWFVLLLLLLLIGGGTTVGVISALVSGNDSPAFFPTGAPTFVPTPSPSTARPSSAPSFRPSRAPVTFQPSAEPILTPQQEDLFDFLGLKSLDGGEALGSPTSPQRNAFRFLASASELMPYEDPLVDVYVMVTLFYSTNGGLWTTKQNWLTPMPICTWFGVTCGSGNGNGSNASANIGEGNKTTADENTFGDERNSQMLGNSPLITKVSLVNNNLLR